MASLSALQEPPSNQGFGNQWWLHCAAEPANIGPDPNIAADAAAGLPSLVGLETNWVHEGPAGYQLESSDYHVAVDAELKEAFTDQCLYRANRIRNTRQWPILFFEGNEPLHVIHGAWGMFQSEVIGMDPSPLQYPEEQKTQEGKGAPSNSTMGQDVMYNGHRVMKGIIDARRGYQYFRSEDEKRNHKGDGLLHL